MQQNVTMQLNVANNAAGDWANRTAAGKAATATGTEIADRAHDELLIRLNGLRGAMEAMKSEPHGSSLAETLTDDADVEFGAPALYHGMRFAVPAAD